jgi:hypothetical protein
MTLTRLAGVNDFVFPVVASASYQQQGIEMSMALDVTGSMCSAVKLDALKTAAQDLFDILLPDGGTPNKVRIALAPYSSGVNAGVYARTVTGMASPPRNFFEATSGDELRDAFAAIAQQTKNLRLTH